MLTFTETLQIKIVLQFSDYTCYSSLTHHFVWRIQCLQISESYKQKLCLIQSYVTLKLMYIAVSKINNNEKICLKKQP